MDPCENKSLMERVCIDRLSALLHGTTPENPVVELDCEILLNGAVCPVHITARAMWSSEETPQYTGAIGKVTQREKEDAQ